MGNDGILGELSTFSDGNSVLARWFARPFKRFMSIEASGGLALLSATAIALIWVNSPWGDTYDELWGTQVNLWVGNVEIFAGHSLVDFVNDAFMVLFFFVVGLEIKRELVDGQLRDPRNAALPAFAAIGGMVVPALLYFVINAGGSGAKGWGIPMATDIAFAVGVVSLVGDRLSRQLRVFLLSLAIVDDIGAILVIAVFYSAGISFGWLAASIALVALVLLMKTLRVWYIPLYILVGTVLWWTTYRSGVHATIAGVVLGLITPARPLQKEEDTRAVARWLRDKPEVFPVDVHYASFRIQESVSVAERLEHALHPITSFFIVPVFALANAGVRINSQVLSDAIGSPVTWGVIVGLLVGKTFGITAFSWAAAKLGLATMPRSMTNRKLIGLSMIAGIGFTVSLFVNGLAFGGGHGEAAAAHGEPATSYSAEAADDHSDDAATDDHSDEADHGDDAAAQNEADAKIGILVASMLASAGGLAILSSGSKTD